MVYIERALFVACVAPIQQAEVIAQADIVVFLDSQTCGEL